MNGAAIFYRSSNASYYSPLCEFRDYVSNLILNEMYYLFFIEFTLTNFQIVFRHIEVITSKTICPLKRDFDFRQSIQI